MHEHGRVHLRQHLDPPHERGDRGGRRFAEPGQDGRVGEPASVEDGHGPGERNGLGTDAGDAPDEAVAQRRYRGMVDRRGGRLPALVRDRLQQLAQVERVA